LQLGNDFDYDSTDIGSKVLTENYELLGEQRLDTNELLLDGKKDFVLAVDFERDENGNATIFQCHNTESGTGFRVNCSEKETTFVWNEKTVTLESGGNFNREMIVIRHNAGDKFVHLYYSQKNKDAILYTKVEALQEPTDALSLVFGCRKNSQNSYSNYAKGQIYWSKLWYGDLGDAACRELAAWPHEQMIFETCSIKGESVNYGAGILTLIGSELLSRPQKMLSSAQVHPDGWTTYKLSTYLNERIYNSINLQYKNLIKKANVPTTYYGSSDAVLAVKAESTRLFLPSQLEVGLASYGPPAYLEEGEGIFDNFAMDGEAICKTPDGAPHKYWLRSLTDWFKYGFCAVNADGASDYAQGTDTNTYVRFMFTI
jgi:hypothetical protein